MEENLQLQAKCLTLISRIAARGARSPDPDHLRDTLMELRYAVGRYSDFEALFQELDFIDATSEPLAAHEVLKYASRTTRN